MTTDHDVADDLELRLLSPEEFERLRALLSSLGYEPTLVKERTEAAMTGGPGAQHPELRNAVDVLVGLFVEERALPARSVRELLSAEVLDLLMRSGLLQNGRDGDTPTLLAPVAVLATGPFYLTCDHRSCFEGSGPPKRKDMVYPPITSSTAEFLSSLPVSPCERVLDLGAGTGVAALLAARTAGRSWAADITARSTRMAEFNARLNGLLNVTAVQGDLYEPVAGLTFDRIVAHPPYMPARPEGLIFRDGGEDGEEILHRIIAGLPTYLEPGGRFHCRCMATDRTGASLEQRIRASLGEAQGEFDVLVLAMTSKPTKPFISALLASDSIGTEEYERYIRTYKRFDVQNILVCTIMLERHASLRAPVTTRRLWPMGRDPDADAPDWLHRWERAQLDDPELDAKLLSARPRIAPDVQVQLLHRALAGELRAQSCSIVSNHPFRFTLESSPGAAIVLVRCDGQRTTAELFGELREMGALPDAMPPRDFLALIRALITGGVLEIDAFPLPPRGGAAGGAPEPAMAAG